MAQTDNVNEHSKSNTVATETENGTLDWNVDMEVQFFHAMKGHKPVGVNRYFQMACIHEKFSNSINKEITSKEIWSHLDSMYDMAALHESEIIPFPNSECDFDLPESDYGPLISKLDEESSAKTVKDSEKSVKSENKMVKTEKGEGKMAKTEKHEIGGGKAKADMNSSGKVSSAASKTPKGESLVAQKTPKENGTFKTSKDGTNKTSKSEGSKIKVDTLNKGKDGLDELPNSMSGGKTSKAPILSKDEVAGNSPKRKRTGRPTKEESGKPGSPAIVSSAKRRRT